MTTNPGHLELTDLAHETRWWDGHTRYPKTRWRDHLAAHAIAPAIRQMLDGPGPWPLVLTGSAGTGKTCTAMLLLDRAGGWYRTLGDFCSDLNAARAGELQTSGGYKIVEGELWRDADRAPLIVVDEIGSRAIPSDHQTETFRKLLDKREGRPMVCISNHGIKALYERYGDPVASRLQGGTIHDCGTHDYRTHK